MKKANIPVIAISAVAVCVIGVATFLGLKATGKIHASEITTVPTVGSSYNYEQTESTTDIITSILDTTYQVATDAFAPSATQSQSQNQASTQTTTKKPSTTATTTQKQEETTQPPHGELDPDEMSSSSGAKPVTPSKNLPKDMSIAGLHNLGYSVYGPKPYIFNDDKDPNCIQRKFGYNPTYDAGAALIDFSIDTVKFDFKYDGKEYRIQFWKGQYISGEIGTVGGEIGLYTRKPGTGLLLDHYNCADEEDWLKMEMTVFWNEFDDGVYHPQLTRAYDDFWWPTGFVYGNLRDKHDSNDLRILGRITFESEEQAELFAQQLAKKGFSQVSNFDPNEIDTFKIYKKDAIFMWQNVR